MKQMEEMTGSWLNIFHFTVGGNSVVYGDRCPGLFVHGRQVAFATALNGNKNGIIHNYRQYPMHAFSHWYYEQRFNTTSQKYVIKVFINNTLVNEVVNENAVEFQNVKLYVSDPWSQKPDVLIKDFKYGVL